MLFSEVPVSPPPFPSSPVSMASSPRHPQVQSSKVEAEQVVEAALMAAVVRLEPAAGRAVVAEPWVVA